MDIGGRRKEKSAGMGIKKRHSRNSEKKKFVLRHLIIIPAC